MTDTSAEMYDENMVFDTEDMDPESVEKGGGSYVNKPGMYHFSLEEVEPRLEKKTKKGRDRSPSIGLKFQVCCDVEGQSPEGSIYYHDVRIGGKGGEAQSEGDRKVTTKVAYLLGVLAKQGEGDSQRYVNAKTGKGGFTIADWKSRIGAQVIGKVEHQPADGDFKERHVVNFGNFYRLDDPEVDNVPKDIEMMKAAGLTANAGSNGSAQPAAATQTQLPDDF